jgi:hypothetical protein
MRLRKNSVFSRSNCCSDCSSSTPFLIEASSFSPSGLVLWRGSALFAKRLAFLLTVRHVTTRGNESEHEYSKHTTELGDQHPRCTRPTLGSGSPANEWGKIVNCQGWRYRPVLERGTARWPTSTMPPDHNDVNGALRMAS